MAELNRPAEPSPVPPWARLSQDQACVSYGARPTDAEWSGARLNAPLPDSPEVEFDLALVRIARLHSERIVLRRYKSLYHEKDEECAVLRQRLRQLAAGNQLSDLCLPIGGVLIGLTASFFDRGHWILGPIVLLIGIVLIGGHLRLKHHRRAD